MMLHLQDFSASARTLSPRRPHPLSRGAHIVAAAGSPHRRSGFTLVEMLIVMTLICILMASSGMALAKANELARRTKAETECRELVHALITYRSTYGEWPGGVSGKDEVEADSTILTPLFDPSANSRHLVFLNIAPERLEGGRWLDPWGKEAYKIFFPDEDDSEVTRETKLETCVSFPFRNKAPN